MANTKTQTASIPVEDLAAALQSALQPIIDGVKPEKPIDEGAYIKEWLDADPVNRLTRRITQNGQPLQIRGISDDTIKHFNELEPGEYINGRVRVVLRGSKPNEWLDIQYPMQTQADRMQNHSLFTSISELMRLISQEQKRKVVASE